MLNWLETINSYFTAPVMIAGLLITGLVISFRTRFVQIRLLKASFREVFSGILNKKSKKNSKTDGISSFKAVSTALAGTLGTGNIAGVAAAVAIGGAGSLFWIWVSAFLGMAVKYAEIVLAVSTRSKLGGRYHGGPMLYIEKATGSRFTACFFAFCCLLTSFGIGNMTQANTAAAAFSAITPLSPFVQRVVFLATAVIIGIVIHGGIKSISGVTSLLVPLMTIFYTICCLTVILSDLVRVPEVFSRIFHDAFLPRSIAGGSVGGIIVSMKIGFARGLFTNEAGLGSAPIAHAAADTDSAGKQGLWGIFEVFLDTIVMCTLTGIVVLLANGDTSTLPIQSITLSAFSQSLGSFAGAAISVSTIFFAIAAIIGWSYYGEEALRFLTSSKRALMLYRFCYCGAIFLGAISSLELVFGISDLLNGLMMLPNLTSIILMSGRVKQETVLLDSRLKGN